MKMLGWLVVLAAAVCGAQGPVALRGVVTSESGAALAGVDVAILSENNVPVWSGKTNKGGHFEFSGIPGEYDLTVKASGFRGVHEDRGFRENFSTPIRMTKETLICDSNCPPPIDLVAVQDAKVRMLSGRVQSHDGSAVNGADVTVMMGSHSVAHTTTNANGLFVFPADAGTYDVSVSLPPYQPMKAMVTFQDGKPAPIVMKKAGFPSEGMEYGVLVQGGNGLTENEGGFHFLMVGLHAGKVLTGDMGPGILKGNFEYAVELFPFWQSYTPKFQRQMCLPTSTAGTYSCSAPYTLGGTFTGASLTPVILRWNLAAGTKWKPWVQGGGGFIWTNHKYPAVGGPPVNAGGTTTTPGNNLPSNNTSVWNFTPQFGVGVHYFVKPKRSFDFGANAVHISSASLGDKNPGVNASVQVNVGYSWWK